jgi:hypothetical protein
MQNGFNVDDTPAYIQVPKGAAGNAAVQLPQEPAYTLPTQNFFEEQNQGTFQFDDTGGFGRFGGYGLDRDDRYYEQMFSKGGIAKLLYRR